jgi:hypothetical protein
MIVNLDNPVNIRRMTLSAVTICNIIDNPDKNIFAVGITELSRPIILWEGVDYDTKDLGATDWTYAEVSDRLKIKMADLPNSFGKRGLLF